MEGRYEPIPIETLEDGALQGYSAVLDLFIRWEHGELRWHDPATGQHSVRFEDERNRADGERARANAEQEARMTAEARIRLPLVEPHHVGCPRPCGSEPFHDLPFGHVMGFAEVFRVHVAVLLWLKILSHALLAREGEWPEAGGQTSYNSSEYPAHGCFG